MRRHLTKKVSAIAPYEDYILKRWEAGCRNATRIWTEIKEQRYPGAYQNVVRITRYLKEQERLGKPIPNRPPGISAGHAAGILVKRPENRSEEVIPNPVNLSFILPNHQQQGRKVLGVCREACRAPKAERFVPECTGLQADLV